ncbi:MAG: hypothetical protein Q4E65_08320 [Clostridia bacterium]|nr:hypothetical protein [Clostridia bacterium]
MKERRIVFTGALRGTARLQADGTAARIQVHVTQGALPERCTAWLCTDALLPLPLTNGAGSAAEGIEDPCGLLLEHNGSIVGVGGFAGRESAQREAALRVRLRTQPQQSRPAPQPAQAPAPIPTPPKPAAAPAPEAENPAAHPSTALQNILRMAELLFPPQQAEQPPQEKAAAPLPYVPFPASYPNAAFRKINYPGSERFYLEGHIKKGAALYELHAIQGEFSPVPPVPGFTRFLRAEDGTGYWVRQRLSRG